MITLLKGMLALDPKRRLTATQSLSKFHTDLKLAAESKDLLSSSNETKRKRSFY